MTVDHVAVVGFDEDTIDIALRWSVAGNYTPHTKRLMMLKGDKFFVLGCTHMRVKNQKIVKEITVFDEIALYANIIRESGLSLPLLQESA
jgi:hypothetical protein